MHNPIPQNIKDYLNYNPISGIITWKSSGKKWGCVRSTSDYLVGGFESKTYLVHRVAWFLQTGDDPGKLTPDHKNGNGLDNRWINLRLADDYSQGMNRGQLGYHWDKEKEQFRVRIRDRQSKQLHLSYEVCPLLARIRYHSAATALIGDIAFVPRVQVSGNKAILIGALPRLPRYYNT